jgi:hypothetical protein
MQCVEFETRLNDILDKRLAPSFDLGIVEHAQSCASCSELLAAHESLLEGIAALPVPRLDDVGQLALAHRAVAEVGSAPMAPFRGGGYGGDDRTSHLSANSQAAPLAAPLELAPQRAAIVARNHTSPLAVIGLILAAAAALLIAVLPWFRAQEQPAAPAGQKQLLVNAPGGRVTAIPGDTTGVLKDYDDLALIARVGYQVADGLTPVTSSMVSALRELRKRPLFRSSADSQGHSSSYLPRDTNELVA